MSCTVWLFICCAAALSACAIANSATATLTKRNLTFSYITTKSGGFISSGGIPVVDLALELINNRTDVLPGYNLAYTTVLDSKVTSWGLREGGREGFCGCQKVILRLSKSFSKKSQKKFCIHRCCPKVTE